MACGRTGRRHTLGWQHDRSLDAARLAHLAGAAGVVRGHRHPGHTPVQRELARTAPSALGLVCSAAAESTFCLMGSRAPRSRPSRIALVVAGGAGGRLLCRRPGGLAVLFFLSEARRRGSCSATYTLAVSDVSRDSAVHARRIPLAEGQSSERLLGCFARWFGWIPGGTAVVCALVCTFFTAFTGGSGVTILALGGLLLPALRQGRLSRPVLARAADRVGLTRAAPAARAAAHRLRDRGQQPIEDLFIGGVFPAADDALIAAWGVRGGVRRAATVTRFAWREGRGAPREPSGSCCSRSSCCLDLQRPATPVEVVGADRALRARHAGGHERELSFGRNLPQRVFDCLMIVGGVFIILGVAVGLTRLLVGAGIRRGCWNGRRRTSSSPLMFCSGSICSCSSSAA